MRPIIAIAAAAFVAGGAAGAVALMALHDRPEAAISGGRPVWTETHWPFPVDEWGVGKAFRCKAADCGTQIDVYLRAKIGFCDCVNGVADDDELDRLTDFSFMGGHVARLGSGHPIAVGWMKGRSRAYGIASGMRSRSSALALAFNDQCDALVATAVLAHEKPGLLEPAVIALLNGPAVLNWTKVTLGD